MDYRQNTPYPQSIPGWQGEQGYPQPPDDSKKQANRLRRKEYNQLGYALFWQMGLAVLVTFLFVFAALFWTLFSEMQRTGIMPELTDPYALLPLWLLPVATFVAMLMANLVPSLFFTKRLGLSLSDMFRPKATTVWVVLGGAAVCLAFNYGASYLMQLLNQLLSGVHLELTTPDLSLNYDTTGNVVMLCYTVIIAPITEELLCRGLLLRTLQRTGRTFAIVGSSLLFAMLHGNLIQGIPTFFIGLALGYIAMRCGSILPTILIHVINNGYVMLLDAIATGNGDAAAYIEYTVLAVAVIAAVVVLIRERKRFSLLSERKAEKGSVGLLLSSWAVLVNLIFYFGISLFFIQVLPKTGSFQGVLEKVCTLFRFAK